jgi:hypothetical protein
MIGVGYKADEKPRKSEQSEVESAKKQYGINV